MSIVDPPRPLQTAPHGADPIASPGDSGRLHGNIGTIELIFTVMAFNAPVVVFLGFIPVAIALGNGIGTPVAFLFCGLVVTCLAVGITTMARRLPNPGGFYAFISAGLGKTIGLGAGFTAIMTYYLALLGGYGLGGVGVQSLVVNVFHGPKVEWWVWAAALFVIASILGYLKIEFSAKVLTAFLALELCLILAYDIGVLAHGGAHGIHFDSFAPHNVFSGSIGIAIMFGIGLYGGFEATVIFRDEVKDPVRTIPRATYAIVALLTLTYAFTAWLFINSYGAEAIMSVLQGDPTSVATQSIQHSIGNVAYDLAATLLVTSSFALILASHNITARYTFNLSADRILPHALSGVHNRFNSPHRASVATSIAALLGCAALVSGGVPDGLVYARTVGAYSYALILLFTTVAISVVVFMFKVREPGESIVKPVLASAFAFIVLIFALYIATAKFDIVVGTQGALTWILLSAVWVVVIAGLIMARIYKRTRPEVYARIGRDEPNRTDHETVVIDP